MGKPEVVWNERGDVAALFLRRSKRIGSSRHVGDVVLVYDRARRLSRVILLDARNIAPPGTTLATVASAVALDLLRRGELRSDDLEALRLASGRAPVT